MTVKVSSGSSVVSPITFTVIVLLVAPSSKTSWPAEGWKSELMVAVPLSAEYSTVGTTPWAAERVTVKVAVVVPASPSCTVTSPIEKENSPGLSSLWTVAVAWLEAKTPPANSLSTTLKVSSGSTWLSPLTWTGSRIWVVPAGMKPLPELTAT